MANRTTVLENQIDLRFRAFLRLTGRSAPDGMMANATGALRVLHELASSPETAPDALALLHEFQVYQVELELQEEGMRNALTELEAALERQIQLYDSTPCGYFTIDAGTAIHEVNLTAAALLGVAREALVGKSLDSFLDTGSRAALHAAVGRLDPDSARESCALKLTASDGSSRSIQACINEDPAGGRFFVAVTGW